ncbi:MAG: EamA family transporter [Chloroflexales bacterium]|nr:EamA family transporter [Chloroflexales bacterium]
MHASPRPGYALCVIAAFVWATTSPGMGYVLRTYHTPALTLSFWRDACIALTLIVALAIASVVRGKGLAWLRVERRALRGMAFAGVVGVGLHHALLTPSILLNGAALAIVLVYTYPTFVTLGARIFFGERIGTGQLVALALSLAGCVLLARAYDPALLRVSWVGVAVGLGTALAHAAYVLSSQRTVAQHSPWIALTIPMICGALTLLVVAAVVQGPASLVRVGGGLDVWLWMVGLSLPTLGGYALFMLSLQHIPGRVASLVVLIEAPVAAGLSVLLLGERLDWPQLVGMGLVLAAAVLPMIRRKKRGERVKLAEDVRQSAITQAIGD